MAPCVLLHLGHLIRPDSDHAKVRRGFRIISHRPLITHSGCMPSPGIIGGYPPPFLCWCWCSSPLGCTLRSDSRYNLVGPPRLCLKNLLIYPPSQSVGASRPSFRRVQALHLQSMATRGDNQYRAFASIWYVIFPAPRYLHCMDQRSFVQDTFAFGVIVYSVRRRGLPRAEGGSTLLDKIVRDATMYFVVIFTSHLLLIIFELFAPVSDFSIYSSSSVPDGLREETDSTPSSEVSLRL